MKSFLTFVLALSCLAIDIDAQTKTTLKPITTKLIATSLTPKLTTLKPADTTTKTTTKATTSRMMTTLKSTVKTTTVKSTTAEPTTMKTPTAKPTTVKPTTAKPTTAEPTTVKTTTVKTTTVKTPTAKPTTVKPTTAKPTTAEPTTVKTTTVKTTTVKTTTAKPTTVKPTTADPTTMKTTTRKINATTTTFKPSSSMTTTKTVTTTASATKTFKICRDTNSTATSGSIQLLDGVTPEGTTPPKTCAFTIIAPTHHKVQMSCSVVNLTKISIFYNLSGGTFLLNSSSLIFDGTLDLNYYYVIVPNRVYTSYNNTMTATYRVVNALDKFECKWTTIKAATTSNFEWCRDSETTAASGTIQSPIESLSTLQNALGNGITLFELYRLCPFFISSSPNHQVQMSCSVISPFTQYFSLHSFSDIDAISYRSKLNMTTALNGTRIELLSTVIAANLPVDCNWTTFTTSNTTTGEANQCVHVQSTVSNGIITPLANNSEINICLFSFIAPLGQRIQISCTVLNFTSNGFLQISGVADTTTNRPYLNKIYTSITNQIDIISSVNNGEWFQCNWTTVKIPPTTDFKLCRDGEATVAIGTIQSFGNTTVGEYPIRCRFSIIAPSNKRVQMYCPTIIVTNSNITADIELIEFYPFVSTIAFPPIANMVYTSKGNEMALLALDSNLLRFNCTWTFV